MQHDKESLMTGNTAGAATSEPDIGEIPLSDADVFEAMSQISGYLDISTEDFKMLCHEAHHQAVDRLVGRLRAESLMQRNVPALAPDMPMFEAAQTIVASGYKGLPVVERDGRVIGMLTENDFLRRLNAKTFLELMLRLIGDDGELSHRCHETRVAEVMVAPPVTVDAHAGFRAILTAFHQHPGRSMPVVDADGRLLGMVQRKDCLAALHLDTLP